MELRPTDLRVKAGPAPTATAGQEATVPFTLEVGTTAEDIPTFALGATTNLAGATATVADPVYQPSAPADASRRTSAQRNVQVKVPATAKPGTYSVTLTTKTPAGASVQQTGSFTVTAAPPPPKAKGKVGKVRLGKLTLNKKIGTATLGVQVSGPGTLTASGKKVVTAVRKATAPGTVKVTIRAKGKAKKKLNKTGKATVKAKFDFKPTAGAPVSRTRSLVLKKNLSK